MSRKPRSVKQVQAGLSDQMRAQGCSWAEVAAEFRRRWNVNARVALRQAHGWTQPEAAEAWNRRWPEDPKSFKNFSYWEAWPSATGYAPSLEVLDRMAQLYECSIADLVADFDDYGAKKKTPEASAPPRASPAALSGPAGPAGATGHSGQTGPALRPPPLSPPVPTPAPAPAVHAPVLLPGSAGSRLVLPGTLTAEPDPARVLGSVDIHDAMRPAEPGREFSRRMALLDISSLFAVAAAAPLFERTQMPVEMTNIDRTVVANTRLIVDGLRMQTAALGPTTTVQTAMSLRAMMESVVTNAPQDLLAQSLTVYGDLAALIGGMMYNLGEDETAVYYYENARAAAYQAGDHEIAANVLAAVSQLRMNQGRHGAAIEHAQAAEEAARASGNRRAMGYAADTAARAYAAAGQAARSQAALDRERKSMGKIDWQEEPAARWRFYDRAFYWGTECETALRLGMPVEAVDAAFLSAQRFNPAYLHNNALTMVLQAEAHLRQGDVTQCCHILSDTARVTTWQSSPRLARAIARVRTGLRDHDGTAAVRDLDAQLALYRPAGPRAGLAAGGMPPPPSSQPPHLSETS